MPGTDDFAAMLRSLADLFANEGRAGGIEAAEAIQEVLRPPLALPPGQSLDITDKCYEALQLRPHDSAALVLVTQPLISWHYSGLDDGRIRPEIALSMATTELIGPDGMLFHPTVRVGLFMQTAGVDYVTRIHAAEETFIILGGSGLWSCDGSASAHREAGAIIHHPSNAPHTSVTTDEPLIAAWRWTGDIGYEKYLLKGKATNPAKILPVLQINSAIQ